MGRHSQGRKCRSCPLQRGCVPAAVVSSVAAALRGVVHTWMTWARSTSPGLLWSLIARLGLTARLEGTLVGAEFVLLVCFRRTGSDSLVVKAGRAGIVDVARLHTRDTGRGCVVAKDACSAPAFL
jgi:hypothetical protein